MSRHTQNYDVEKAHFGNLALDPTVAGALTQFLSRERQVDVSEPIDCAPGANVRLSSVRKGTDVLTLDLHKADGKFTVDLGRLDRQTLRELDAVMFRSDNGDPTSHTGPHDVYNDLDPSVAGINLTDIELKLATFSGVVVLTDGDNMVSGQRAGRVAVQTGSGNDTVETGQGNDTVVTGAGNDSVVTGAGQDLVRAGEGNDYVDAGNGNDTVLTGGGVDTVKLGSGNDVIVIEQSAGPDPDMASIDGGQGTDLMDLTGVSITAVEVSGGGLLISLADGSQVFATDVESFLYDSPHGPSTELVGVVHFLADF